MKSAIERTWAKALMFPRPVLLHPLDILQVQAAAVVVKLGQEVVQVQAAVVTLGQGVVQVQAAVVTPTQVVSPV